MNKQVKILWATICISFVGLLTPITTHAALVVVSKDGEAVWNVLSVTTNEQSRESLQVVSVAQNQTPNADAVISLISENGKIQLQVVNGNQSKSTDVTGYTEEIIAVEEREAARKLSILTAGEEFIIKQDAIAAKTSFPITINAKNKELSVLTPSGLRFIKVLPSEVLDNAIKADIIDTVSDQAMLIEGGQGELEYQLSGEKHIDLFDLIKLNAPVTLAVSATTGEVIKVDRPEWLRIFGFLFS